MSWQPDAGHRSIRNPSRQSRRGPQDRSIPQGSDHFLARRSGDAVFYIQKGKAKITVVSEQGKEAVVAILGANEFFGEGCLAGQSRRIATVTTMTESVIMRLEKDAIVV